MGVQLGIAAFPLYRNRKILGEIRGELLRRHGESANLYWRARAKELLGQLTGSGIEEEVAREEVRQLLYAALEGMHRAEAGVSA